MNRMEPILVVELKLRLHPRLQDIPLHLSNRPLWQKAGKGNHYIEFTVQRIRL